MNYNTELNFFQKILKNIRVKTSIIKQTDSLNSNIDSGLRLLLNLKDEYNKNINDVLGEIESNTVYSFTDVFQCSYILFKLPESNGQILLIGPFLKNEFTKNDLVFLCEKLNVNKKNLQLLENYFGAVPYISDSNVFYGLIDTFCETVFKNNKKLSYVELHDKNSEYTSLMQNGENDISDEEKTMLNMKMMEARYDFENQLISAVSHGQTHISEKLISSFSEFAFEERLNDKLRNYKNYCIIMNTLLRKAAERGGVHPLYIDKVSSAFAKEIEAITNIASVSTLMAKCLKKYCNLVRENSIKNFSAPVQKTIIFIDSDLTGDLSLNHLAKIQNISPAYLSNIFHKETGETLTEFVNKRRVDHACKLLKTTNLQIQTIAQNCGIVDVHYFSKIFKKIIGSTPKYYREQVKKL